jgi:hypothetical protein
MRKLLPALAVIAGATAIAAPANATVYIDFLQGTPVSSLAGYTVVNNFNSAAGITGSNFQIQNNSDGNGAIIPLSDSQGSNYLTVKGGGTANIGLPTATSGFAFEWGSLDTYNTLTINLAGGSSIVLVPGQNQLSSSPGNGNQFLPNTNGTLRIFGDAGEVFTGLKLQSSGNSMEIDNLAIKGAVPEASTWAMMIFGLGAVGTAMRRKRNVAVSFA